MRLFFGLPLSREGKELVLSLRNRLGDGTDGLEWSPAENLHLTLSFLGEVGEEGLSASRRALDALELEDGPQPLFQPSRLGFFPDRGPPRVFVLLENSPSLGLLALHHGLCGALARESRAAGLPPLDSEWPEADREGSRPRRPFTPHLTLARLRGRSRPRPFDAETLASTDGLLSGAPPLPFDRLILFESRTLRRGPVYTPLAERRIGGKAAGH
ncbi:MAG TPA: 2'-5' RNA ligase family protein [Rectinemataceae bacterium]|nr:2'-5' RNA ligase family protein [Rectinemataceae bacterium]